MARRVKKIQDPELARALRAGLEQGLFSVVDAMHALRAIGGTSQRAFARQTHVPESVVKLIESGQANPNLVTLEKIAAAFDLRIAFVSARGQVGLFDAQAWCEEGRERGAAGAATKATGSGEVRTSPNEISVEARTLSYELRGLA